VEGGAGQSVSDISTQPGQAASTPAAETETFTDFNLIPDEMRANLEPFYKQMQADYTRKTQKLSKAQKDHLQKVQAYDQFMANPLDNLMRMAQQYGLQFTPQGQPIQEKQPAITQDWTPNTWEEVFGKSAEYLEPKFKEMLSETVKPYQEEIAALKAELGTQRASRIEQQFNKLDPNWRQYEDEMRELLQDHPSLAKDPIKLYRLAVPEDVFKARATQDAIKSLEAKTQAAKIETSGKSKPSAPARQGPMSFQEAFELAKQQVGRK
jgi:AraC-like DNA-binding protein